MSQHTEAPVRFVELKDLIGNFNETDAPNYTEILNCMHCGMCLPTCPTYLLTGRERSSPRGRIALMRGVAEGELAVTETFAQEMFFCLGCLACITACPAGVEYGHLLETARAQVNRTQTGSRIQQMVKDFAFGLFESPRQLRTGARFMRFYQRSGLRWLAHHTGVMKLFPGKLDQMEELLPPIPSHFAHQLIPEVIPAEGRERARVGILLGCVMDLFFVPEQLATVQVLARNGCTVVAPKTLDCCGALHAHAGVLEEARELAKRQIVAFDAAQVDAVVINSAGCGSTMKGYGHLLADDPQWAERATTFSARVRDIHEFLLELPYDPPTRPLNCKLTYHDACHLAHGQGITQPPRRILEALPGVEYVELDYADRCCGSAGIYNITHYDEAMELLDDKVDHIVATGADVVGVANPGCLIQIRYGLRKHGSRIRAEHPIALLAEAYGY